MRLTAQGSEETKTRVDEDNEPCTAQPARFFLTFHEWSGASRPVQYEGYGDRGCMSTISLFATLFDKFISYPKNFLSVN